MEKKTSTISACLVVYNEEGVIERCLKSIIAVVDEIIIIHDGPCSDRTLEIARKYTDKIYIEPRIGIGEPHRSTSFVKAKGEWILQIDADEYIDENEVEKIKNLINQSIVDGYYFKWEMWDGKQPVYFKGLQKMVLFRKNSAAFEGLPQKEVTINGNKVNSGLHLHHRPVYENISWAIAKKKREYWLKAHVPYYFPELVTYQCFQTTIDSWISYTNRVRQHPWFYILWYPVKNCLGQLKNGLFTSRIGIRIALQQYLYYVALYFRVWKKNRELRQKNKISQ